MPDETRTWGLRPLERQLAVVVGIAMGLAWATITGAGSTVAGRVAYFAMGTPLGALAGLRIGQLYLDEGPGSRRFVHVMTYIFGVLAVSAAVGSGDATVPGLIGAACYVPTPFLLARNALTERGDRRLAARLIPATAMATILLVGLRADRGWIQVAVIVALVVMSGWVAMLDRSTRRAREARGELRPVPPPTPARGWRLWVRLVGASIAVFFAIGAVTATVEARGVDCGSLGEALAAGRAGGCEQEAGMHVAGGLVFLLVAGVLLAGALRGRGRGSATAREAPRPEPQPPSRPPRTRPLRARETDR